MADDTVDGQGSTDGGGGEDDKKQRKVTLKTFARMLDSFTQPALSQLRGEDLLTLRDTTLDLMREAVEAECAVRAAKFAGIGRGEKA